LKANVPVAVSTDMSFGQGDPWAAMCAAVHRATRSGAGLNAGECIPARRTPYVMNSRPQALPPKRLPYNPAFVHPDDLACLNIQEGDLVVVESAHATVVPIAAADKTLRRGLVSMSHNRGHVPDFDATVRQVGTNSGGLVANDGVLDPYWGQPQMSNVPVHISPAPQATDSATGIGKSMSLQ
jgi:Molydopterin dinucleotide binding domain